MNTQLVHRRRRLGLFTVLVWVCLSFSRSSDARLFAQVDRVVPSGYGQWHFELNARKRGIKASAVLTTRLLQVVDSSGQVTNYVRTSRYDSDDRQWLGFYSQDINQVIRWPIGNNGRFKIGTPSGNSVTYRLSEMEILSTASTPAPSSIMEPIGGQAGQRSSLRPELPLLTPQTGVGELLADLAVSKLFDVISKSKTTNASKGQLVRLASVDSRGAPWLLSHDSTRLRAVSNSGRGADWWVSPVGNGYVRVQSYSGGKIYSLAANRGGRLNLDPATQDPQQFWRVSGGRGQNRFVLENVAYAGNCLAHLGGGNLALQPITYAPTQMWSPYVAPSTPAFQPFWRSVNTEIVPNSQLPPAQLQLINTHKYALVVALGDIRRGNDFDQIRIEPNSSETVQLDRDSGATIVETVEIRSPLGGWKTEQYVTAIPPRALYDISVYEEHLQSIAIDATGTSPNPIEDVNYVPKSVGWLPLPAGQGIPAYGRIDLYPKARERNNPGAVRRLDPKQFDAPPAERPLESIKNRLESLERKKF